MTQEEKNLLIKDLSARLPYGVKLLVSSWDGFLMEYTDKVDTLYSINGDGYIRTLDEDYNFTIEEVKPYLFPLSSMTDEQKKEIDKIYINSIDDDSVSLRYHSEGYWDDVTEAGFGDYLWIIDWFNKNHFDYQGLIKKGLALDATGLNIY